MDVLLNFIEQCKESPPITALHSFNSVTAEKHEHETWLPEKQQYQMIDSVTEKFHSSILIKQGVFPRAVDGRLTHV